MCSHQETGCCSTMDTLEKAKQLMEEHVRYAEEVSRMIALSPLADEMDRCSGFVTALRVISGEGNRAAQEELDLLFLQREQSQDAGLRERLKLFQAMFLKCFSISIALEQSLRRVEALAGHKRTADLRCQCTTMKEKRSE